MNRMKRRIFPISHLRGLVSHSASTWSVGMVVCEKSYRRLLVSTWIGSMGRNGRNALAPTTLNMLPKLELAAILMYLMMLPNTRRPSSTPCCKISRLCSKRMMSDDSLAMSTVVHRNAFMFGFVHFALPGGHLLARFQAHQAYLFGARPQRHARCIQSRLQT